MADWLVIFLAISGSLIAGFYRYVLGKVVPKYLETANKVPLSQWLGKTDFCLSSWLCWGPWYDTLVLFLGTATEFFVTVGTNEYDRHQAIPVDRQQSALLLFAELTHHGSKAVQAIPL